MTLQTPHIRRSRPGGWRAAFAIAAIAWVSGCQPEASNCSADSDCEAGWECASGGGLLVRGGVCVMRDEVARPDVGADVGPGKDVVDTEDILADADDAGECIPQTCADLEVTCGVVDDGCGDALSCGGAECVASLSAGAQHSCAVRGDGSIYCWGANQGGQLGSGDFDDQLTPTRVLMSSVNFKATAVSAGQQHSCALNEKGLAWCWGSNQLVGSGECFGQLGTGDDCATLPRTNRPAIAVDREQVEPRVVSLQTRENLNCMRNHAGQAYCWGSGAHGQVGNGESLAANIAPTQVQGYAGEYLALGLSECYACGLSADGLVCWGDFADGCSGAGEQNQAVVHFDAYQFETSACVEPDGCIAGGRAHTCFIDALGKLYCFNDNASGQLGIDPSTPRSATPLEVGGLPGFVIQVVAGDQFSCALQSNGDVYCWGANGSGQLGDASQTDSFTPVKVGLSAPAERISAGALHACAALEAGEVQCWGDNGKGQLGNGTSGSGELAASPVTVQF